MERKDQTLILAIAIESGLANIALLSNYSLTPVTEIHENIPGKRYEKQAQKEMTDSFFSQITTMILDHTQRYEIGMIILCGPGFTKEQYADILRDALKKTNKSPEIRNLRSQFRGN